MSLIGVRIKKYRKLKNMSQEELSCSILTRTVISKIENGKIMPSVHQLVHIANKLNLSLYDIIEEKNTDEISNGSSITQSRIVKLYNEKRYYDILKIYEGLEEKAIYDEDLYFYVAIAYYETNYIKEALKIFRVFVKNYSNYSEDKKNIYVEKYAVALNYLCKIMLKNNNYEKAIHYCSIAIRELEKENQINIKIYCIVISNIGAIYYLTNKFSKAIKVLEEFLMSQSEVLFIKYIPDIHLTLNLAYYNLGRYDKAIEHIKKAIFLYNYVGRFLDEQESYLNFINALRHSRKFDQSLKVLEDYKEKYKDNDNFKMAFFMQEIILNFNTERYEMVTAGLSKIKIKECNSCTKNNYYFIKGFMYYLEEKYFDATTQFLKCKKYFEENNFAYDLYRMYEILYKINGEEEFNRLAEKNKNILARKNIFV